MPAKNAKTFRDKRAKQRKTYNYCKALFVDVYGSEDEMQEIIRAGIIDYFQETPENICKEIASGKVVSANGIGIATEIIVAIIGAVVTVVTGVITAICTMVAQTNVAKYAALDSEVVNTSIPTPEDYDGLSGRSVTTAGASKWLMVALLGTAAVWFLKNKKH